MSREIVYDLTEVLLASTGKLRYYGIVRVVAEVGRELVKAVRRHLPVFRDQIRRERAWIG